MTSYYFVGVNISHNVFVSLCHSYGIHPRSGESYARALVRLADADNPRALELLRLINFD